MGQYHPGMIRANMQMRLQNVKPEKGKEKAKTRGQRNIRADSPNSHVSNVRQHLDELVFR